MPDVSSSSIANLRRAKSLDRRVTESSMTVRCQSARTLRPSPSVLSVILVSCAAHTVPEV